MRRSRSLSRAALQNAVGNPGADGLQGVRFGGYGGNRNRVQRGEAMTVVAMDKAADPVATGPVKVRTAAGKEVHGPEMLWLSGTRIRDILNQGLPTDPHRYLATGQRVRVKYGPLVGLEGFIVRRKKRTRFVVIIESIRRAISVEVGELELEAIAPRSRENSLVCAHG